MKPNRLSRSAAVAVPRKPSRPVRRWLELVLEADAAIVRGDRTGERTAQQAAKKIFGQIPESKRKFLVEVAQMLELELENAGHDGQDDDEDAGDDEEREQESEEFEGEEQDDDLTLRSAPAPPNRVQRPREDETLEVIQSIKGFVPRQLVRDADENLFVTVGGKPVLTFPPNADPAFIRRVFVALDQLL